MIIDIMEIIKLYCKCSECEGRKKVYSKRDLMDKRPLSEKIDCHKCNGTGETMIEFEWDPSNTIAGQYWTYSDNNRVLWLKFNYRRFKINVFATSKSSVVENVWKVHYVKGVNITEYLNPIKLETPDGVFTWN